MHHRTLLSPRHQIPAFVLLFFFASTSVAWASGAWGLLQFAGWMFVAAPAGVIIIGLCIWMAVELKGTFNPNKNYARRAKWAWKNIVGLTILALIAPQVETFFNASGRATLIKNGLLFSIPTLGLAFLGYFLTSSVKERNQEEAPDAAEEA